MSLSIIKLLTRVGIKREDFSIAFSLSNISGIEHFVAREEELAELHKTLSGDGSRRTVFLHGLGGIGKTQLSVAYVKRHKDTLPCHRTRVPPGSFLYGGPSGLLDVSATTSVSLACTPGCFASLGDFPIGQGLD
jgi:hypothetical protein